MRFVHVRWVHVFAAVSCCGVLPTRAFAQRLDVAESSASRGSVVHTVAEETFYRPVSIRIARMTVKQAVDTLAMQAHVRIHYQAADLDGISTRVSLDASQMALGAVLDRILAGTGLYAVSSIPNVVTIKPLVREQGAVQGTIVGKVVHAKTKAPIAGAVVVWGNPEQRTTTGTDGTFRATAAPGDVTLSVRGIGFMRQAKTVRVTEGESVAAEIALEPSASVLDEVIVTGSIVATERKAISTPITVITAEEIERRGIMHIEEFFRGEVPGVVALDKGAQRYAGGNASVDEPLGAMISSKIYVRGSSGVGTPLWDSPEGSATPLKTYIDGVELLDPSYLGTIDINSIERIEIVTGPQAATIYGTGALGGVMQIFTKKGNGGQRTEVTANLRYGFLESNLSAGRTPQHADVLTVTGGLGQGFQYTGTLTYNATGQWQPGLYDRSIGATIGAVHSKGGFQAQGSVSVTTGKNGTGFTTEEGGDPHSRYLIESGEARLYNVAAGFARRHATSASQTTSLNLQYRPSAMWQHRLEVGSNQTALASVPDAPRFVTPGDTLWASSSSFGSRKTVGYHVTFMPANIGIVSSVVSAGASGSRATQSSVYGCRADRLESTTIDCDSYNTIRVSTLLDAESWGAFASWRIGLFEQLHFSLGARLEKNPAFGRDVKVDFTPSNGLAWAMELGSLTVKLLGSYGRATRAPDPDWRREKIYSAANFDPSQWVGLLANGKLTPEYSRGPQGGVELYYGNLGSFTINRYVQLVDNIIQQVPVDTVYLTWLSLSGPVPDVPIAQFQYRNTASIRNHGIETTGSINLGPLGLRGTYSWTDSRVRSVRKDTPYGTTLSEGGSFWGVPTHTANVIATYARGRSSVTIVGNWIGASMGNVTPSFAAVQRLGVRLPMYFYNVRSNLARFSSIPGYAKWNLTASHRLNEWASGTLKIDNVTNLYRSDVTLQGSAVLGRQTFIGLSLRFPQR